MSKEQTKQRPLSPHLFIYRPQITSVSSIFHRFSAVVLALGFMVLCTGLIAFGHGFEMYQRFTNWMTTPLGWLFLFGWSAAFFYHACTGVRHLIFDSGFLFKRDNAAASGFVVFGAAILLTILFWTVVV